MQETSCRIPVTKTTACILCSTNCGLQFEVEDGHFKRIKGDKTNPR
jgi:anaerobic selenocysteine-containing dehydrogenase